MAAKNDPPLAEKAPPAPNQQQQDPNVVLYSSSSDSNRRASIIGKPPPADLFSSLRLETAGGATSPPASALSPTSGVLSPGSSAIHFDDGSDPIPRRPSVVSFNEPASHGDRTRNVGSLYQQLHGHPAAPTPDAARHYGHKDTPTSQSGLATNPQHPAASQRKPPIVQRQSSGESSASSITPVAPVPVRPPMHKVSSMIIDPIAPSDSQGSVAFNAPAKLPPSTAKSPTSVDSRPSQPPATTRVTSPPAKPEQRMSPPFKVPKPVNTGADKGNLPEDYQFISRRDSRLESVKRSTDAPASTTSQSGVASSASSVDQDAQNEKQKLHILVAATGSVATIKIPLIIGKLRKMYGSHAVVQVIVTTAAEHFLKGVKLPPDVKVWHDHDEWTSRRGVAETVLHVQLRRWADILLIAPLSANTLAKMANGICDNLITSVFRSWNTMTPVVVAPAMNTHMYTNPMTKKHLMVLKESFPYVQVLKPIEKVLVCGDIGMGGMREWTDVVDNVVRQLGGPPMSVEEEEAEEERELREKRAKKRRESVDRRAAVAAKGEQTTSGVNIALNDQEVPREEDDAHHDEDDDDDDDNDDDDDDDEDVEEGDEEDDEEFTPSTDTNTGPSTNGSLKVQKPKLTRANTAEI